MLAFVGIGVVVVTTVLVWIAWLFVAAPPATAHPAARPSMLEHALFERAPGGDRRGSGPPTLEEYRWVDRENHLVQLPIDRAIDAVVADPDLLRQHRAPMAGP